MSFELIFTNVAKSQYENLKGDYSQIKRFKAVRKALAFLESNPRHSSLHTHKFHTKYGENGEEVFEAYAENHTPCAYRIFWHYGPNKNQITILSITPHP